MTVQFYANKIFVLEEDVPPDFEKGQIFCTDKDGEWYYHTLPKAGMQMDEDPSCWPAKGKKGIQLHRDYWRHTEVKERVGAPYFDALRNAKYRTIK